MPKKALVIPVLLTHVFVIFSGSLKKDDVGRSSMAIEGEGESEGEKED